MENESIPMEDRKKKKKVKKQGASVSFSPEFTFKEFKVGNLENASAINFGNNYPTNFKGYKRHSQGLGTIDGNHNDIHDIESYMNQQYLLDAIMDKEEELPEWIKDLIKDQKSKILDDDEFPNTEKIFNEINKLLAVEITPVFFDYLFKENKFLFKKIWKSIKKKWKTSEEFHMFYENILSLLNKVPIQSNPLNLSLQDTICKKNADSMEEKSKTLLIIIYLIQTLTPEYLKKYKNENLTISNEQVTTNNNLDKEQIIQGIKHVFHLKDIPTSFTEVKEYPGVLESIFHDTLSPIIISNVHSPFFYHMKGLYVWEIEKAAESVVLENITIDEQKYLLPLLMKCLEEYPKYLFLEYLIIPFCKADSD